MNQIATVRDESRFVSEAGLIAEVLAGDRMAARKMYEAHAPRIYRLVHRLAGDAELAQDLTQETFIRAFRRLVDFRGDAALATWLHRIAVSVTLNGLRKVNRFRKHEIGVEDDGMMESMLGDKGVEAPALSIEPNMSRRLTQELDALPEVLRITLVMHDIEGYTHGEIAAVLEVPEGTCKTRLSMARTRLKQALAPYRES